MRAIIIKKMRIRENDELIVCYTREAGKQVYHAKSILRPTSRQASHLDVLSMADFSLVHGKNYSIIASAHAFNSFPNIKSSLGAMSAAYFLLECFDKLVLENQPDDRLWEFLCSRLACYEEIRDVRDWLFEIEEARKELLRVLGYDEFSQIEQLANSQFKSLQFARKVLI